MQVGDERIFDPKTVANYIELSFSEDVMFSIKTSLWQYSSIFKRYIQNDHFNNTYKGTYKYENNILTLTYDGKDHPLVVIDGVIYFITFSK